MTSKEHRDFCREMAAIWDPPRGKVTESIYSGKGVIVPLADVQHIEVHNGEGQAIPGIVVVTRHTTYNFEHDGWNNGIWISEPEATDFRAAWCRYRSELEADTLADLSPVQAA